MPKWLDERIETSRRAAKRAECSCGARVLIGDDHDRVAMRVVIDVEPVSHAVEIGALRRGVVSFDVASHGDSRVIWHRDDFRVASLDARAHAAIHLEHVCEQQRDDRRRQGR